VSLWVETTIGEKCEVISGQSPLGKFYNDIGNGLPFYQGKKEFGEKYIGAPSKWTSQTTKEAEAGDILMSVRAPVGPINFSTERICIGRGLAAIRAGYEIEREFLFYALLSKQDEISGNEGAVFASINKKQIESIELNLPTLTKQKRIVALLDEAFAGISQAVANAEKNLTNARELFDSYLNNVFTQKGDGWADATVSELVEREVLAKPLDGNHGDIHPKKADFVAEGVPFIMASDLKDGEVDQSECNFISREQGDSLRKGFAKNADVLLSHKGTIGRVAVLKTEHDYVMLTPQVTYYRITDQGILNNRYLYYFFQSPEYQREMREIAGSGSTRAYIGITKQLDLHISYPSIEVQIELSSTFDILVVETQRLEAIYKQKLSALAELKQSILQKAFSGELTGDAVRHR
jgi:type I restriction enzyme S subunit